MSPYALHHIQINIIQLGVQWHNFFYFKSLTKISDPGLVDWPWSCCGPLTPWSPAPPVHQPTGTFIQVIILANLLKATDFNFKCGSGTRKFNYETGTSIKYSSGTKLQNRYQISNAGLIHFFSTHPVQNLRYISGTNFLNTRPVQILNTHSVRNLKHASGT